MAQRLQQYVIKVQSVLKMLITTYPTDGKYLTVFSVTSPTESSCPVVDVSSRRMIMQMLHVGLQRLA